MPSWPRHALMGPGPWSSHPWLCPAPWWKKLLRASIVPNAEGYLRVRKQQSQLGSDIDGELAIFSVDVIPATMLV